ncbi:hypothetical protein A3A71_02305 [Candidatus Berkelbacteria bacterium RIFCSPLOWO2_01_FULL_50_28]|uniref:DNA polymerase IV n=1 Tax=Candidatus Berkelbacteria bacterium RIFCSPLOWO2_01_FULL_50_28 TaxID=1797471 RepID=A0A1F5EC60_9BACT|nr:MAG: hypothetical protein A2807_00700 [Candidatus Berkelbacteria bacterium RIFCSPHIGHO2_01_FULL_50_36]OGD62214.1 MAG: hypothetical protein A3F39_00720 [Candidatus Berkelbacteria bacterium RIFCSPHIGHO2_12_FULL_50_11]OGD64856.1 MAG: hypothetical protein A3A71_02305 [Candidatus Berkelbacteria bacterium RIFCSPLOWO2_01_FULL_50_28]
MKKILHLDVNSYFATLEQQAYPSLRGKPIGVAGKGKGERTVVAGASIEAKKFGVKSGMSSWEAKRLCPKIIIIEADYDRYIFTSKRIFNIMERFGPKVDIFSIDEAFLDLYDDMSWDEAIIIAKRLKQAIRREIGEWVSCSVGISYGKTLAKLASEMQKPDGLTVIRPEDFAKIAAVTPIEELCGIGFRLHPRLNRMGINTIAELGSMPCEMLTATFGEYTGTWLHNIGNGRDSNILHSWRSLPQEKSIGHSYTLPQDIANPSDVKKVLLLLCERVGARMRQKNLAGKTVSLYLRFGDRTGFDESRNQKRFLRSGYDVYLAAENLLHEISSLQPVRLVAVTVSDLTSWENLSAPLFVEEQRQEALNSQVHSLNRRYGEFTVFRGALAAIKKRIHKLPDGRNKRLYLPQITEINPFTKRV